VKGPEAVAMAIDSNARACVSQGFKEKIPRLVDQTMNYIWLSSLPEKKIVIVLQPSIHLMKRYG
jgi:hypothetical protein